jgi:hypothetical protein
MNSRHLNSDVGHRNRPCDEMILKERDIAALILGVLLGGVATYLGVVMARYFALPGAFVLCGVFFPLLVSLVAERRPILASLVPNVVMMLGLVIYFLPLRPDTQPWLDTVYLFLIMLAVGMSLPLVVSVPIHLLRNRRRRDESPPSIFPRDAQQIVGRERRGRVS